MEEKDKSQQGQELLDVDEKGKTIEKKEVKKPAKNSETYTIVLVTFLVVVIIGLYLKIWVFNKDTTKHNNYHKLKTADDMNRNIGEAIVRFVRKNPKAKIRNTKEMRYHLKMSNFSVLMDYVVFPKMIKIVTIIF